MKQRLIVVATIVGLAMVVAALGHIPAARADDLNNWSKTGNAGTTPGTNFVGTTDNQALELKVNNTRALRLEPTSGTPNLIGGDSTNSVLTGAVGATISGGGGGTSSGENRVFDNYGVIGGGALNRVGTENPDFVNQGFGTVGGGINNVASGFAASISGGASNSAGSTYSAVGGGYGNTSIGDKSTVSGGVANTASSDFTVVAGGSTNIASGYNSSIVGGSNNVASGSGSFVGAGHANQATNYRTTVGGGEGNTAAGDSSTVGGGFANNATDATATIGGGTNNQAGNNAEPLNDRLAATVAGGDHNIASGAYSTVAGGRSNSASGSYAATGGGYLNITSNNYATISGGYTNLANNIYATISGGRSNTASGQYATVSGGYANTASLSYATVTGGSTNLASGSYSTVAGGLSNTAQGSYSYAAGRRAKATTSGSFVWGDGTDADIAPTANNQFIARASGGTTFYSNAAATAGVRLAPGGGSWSTLSDRNMKANFAAVDSQSILEQVAAMPIQLWNYKSQDASVKHIGPMAQDFSAAFGVGEDDKHISTVDADGVALAAIQGLYTAGLEKDRALAALKAEKDQQIATLQERLTSVEQAQRGGSNTLLVAPTGLTISWSVVALGILLVLVLLILSSVSLTLLFLRRRTIPA
jgi:hypothetical protein